jgi:hypothetical protein
MKLLIILIATLFIGCEKEAAENDLNPKSILKASQNINRIPSNMENSNYTATNCVSLSRGFSSLSVVIADISVMLTTIYHRDSTCSGVGFDRTYSYYDLVDSEITYTQTDYTDMVHDGYQACDFTGLTTGVPYDADGIDCGLSYENTSIVIESIGDGKFKVNDNYIIQ